jgi:hypothetical protein
MAKSLQEQGAKQDKTHEMAIRHDEQILALSREIREFRRLCEDFRRSCQFKNHGKEGE